MSAIENLSRKNLIKKAKVAYNSIFYLWKLIAELKSNFLPIKWISIACKAIILPTIYQQYISDAKLKKSGYTRLYSLVNTMISSYIQS